MTTTPDSASDRPADHPRVPRLSHRGFGAYFAAALTILVVGGYGWIGYTQRQLGGGEDKDIVPTSVRASPGGYRSFHFWHSGYHGGK